MTRSVKRYLLCRLFSFVLLFSVNFIVLLTHDEYVCYCDSLLHDECVCYGDSLLHDEYVCYRDRSALCVKSRRKMSQPEVMGSVLNVSTETVT